MITNTYTVSGMTCSHCVHAVTTEVSAIPRSPRSRSTCPRRRHRDERCDAPVEELRSAIDEAGYELVG